MARLTLALWAVAAVGLAGCATETEILKYSKPGATYDEYLKDRYACLNDGRGQASSGVAANGRAIVQSGEVIRSDLVAACMAARGYRQDPNGFGPPAGGQVEVR